MVESSNFNSTSFEDDFSLTSVANESGVVSVEEMVQQIINDEEVDPNLSALGLKLTSFNAALWRSRRQKGLTQKQLAQQVGVSLALVSHYETLRAYPPSSVADRIAQALGQSPETLFPSYLQMFLRDKDKPKEIRLEVPMSQMKKMLLNRAVEQQSLATGDNLESLAEKAVLKEEVESLLDSLPSRERMIIKLRFGIDEGRENTLDESARALGIGIERARQIEVKALRKLRHPSRSKKLIPYLEKSNEGANEEAEALKNGLITALQTADLPRIYENIEKIRKQIQNGAEKLGIKHLIKQIIEDPSYRPPDREVYRYIKVVYAGANLDRLQVKGIQQDTIIESIAETMEALEELNEWSRQAKLIEDIEERTSQSL